MATTSLTVATKSVNEGHEHSQFHLYGSTPDSGTVEQGTGLWWVERGGVQHTRADSSDFVAEGLVFGYVTLEDGDIVHAQFIDAAGNAGAIVTHTCTVSSTWDGSMYVDPTLGNDTTGDGSSGNPYATIAKAITETQAAWTSGDARRILLKKGETHSTSGGGSLWTLNTSYPGHICFQSYGSGAKPILNLAAGKLFIGGTFGDTACTIIDLDIRGNGSGGTSNDCFLVSGTSTGTEAAFAVIDCDISAFDTVSALSGYDGLAGRDTIDFIAFVRVTMDDYAGVDGHAFIGGAWGAYFLMSECTFLESASANHFVRIRAPEYAVWDRCTWDLSTATAKGNNMRILGGAGSTSDDYAQRCNVYGCQILAAEEGFELDNSGTTGTEYFKDIDYNACGVVATTTNGSFLKALGGGGGNSLQLTRIRARNCWWKGEYGPMFSISNPDASEGTIDSVTLEHCTAFFAGDSGSYSVIPVLLSCTGTTGVSSGAFTYRNCVGYCSGTGGGGALVTLVYVGAYAQVNSASDYNTVRKAGGTVAFGSMGGNYEGLSTWQGNVSGDDNSTTESTGSSGFVSESTPDLRPSSGSWFGAGLGGAGVAYADADFTLWDASTPDVGAFQWAGSAVPGPTFGGGSPYTLTAEAGVFTLTGVAANVLADRLLTADTGTYSLTGVAANMIYSGASGTATQPQTRLPIGLRLGL